VNSSLPCVSGTKAVTDLVEELFNAGIVFYKGSDGRLLFSSGKVAVIALCRNGIGAMGFFGVVIKT
jgi:hypothetical protein